MKITVVGLGHLGTVAAGGLATAGHDVTGLDIDEWRIQSLKEGQMPFYEPGLQECVVSAVDRGNLRFWHSGEFSGKPGECRSYRRWHPRRCQRGGGPDPSACCAGLD